MEGEDFDEGGEGEEEEPRETDDLVEDSDMEVEDKMSMVSGATGLTGVSRMSKIKRGPLSIVPQKMDLGSVAADAEQPKKVQKRKKEEADESGDPTELVSMISADDQLQLDDELQTVADALGSTPPCFQGLLVSRVLAGEKPGHQIKGVSDSVSCDSVVFSESLHFKSCKEAMKQGFRV